MAITLNKSYLSLQRGRMYQLEASEPCTWETSNPLVRVTPDGVVYAVREDKLRPYGQATITATAISDNSTATCKVTIVNWTANRHGLELVEVIADGTWITKDSNDEIYYTNGNGIYRLSDNHLFGVPPTYPQQESFIDTPFGYFYRSQDNSNIYRSFDLEDWELISSLPTMNSLYHAFAWKYDEVTGKGYLFVGEYSLEFSDRHKVYRITINPDNTYSTDVVLEFYSADEYDANPENVPACLHIHVVVVDPYTGDIWVGTGDNSAHAAIYCSTDNGGTWTLFGTGENEAYRSLSIWFTERYIYWNMDSMCPQRIYRIKRTDLPDSSKKECVAKLDNGSMWYHVWAKDTDGNDFVIMAQAAEGERRDWLARVYGIWELEDGRNVVEELLCIPSSTPNEYVEMVQLEPKFVVGEYIYFGARNISPGGFWKMRLVKHPVDYKPLIKKIYRYFRARFA